MSNLDIRPPDQQPEEKPAPEAHDVNVRGVLYFALALALSVAILLPLLVWYFNHLYARAERASPELSPLAEREAPSGPRLQAHPLRDLQNFRREEEAVLNSYGWVDREQQTVRIPIDRAMQLIAERGMPPVEPSTPQAEAAQRGEAAKGEPPPHAPGLGVPLPQPRENPPEAAPSQKRVEP